MKYQPSKIEKKWQKYWEDNNTFVTKDNDQKAKFYGLVEFPYPSVVAMSAVVLILIHRLGKC